MHISRAVPSNTTIDDTISNSNSDTVAYDPPELWLKPDGCPRVPCSGFPDKNKTFSNTWHTSVFSAKPDHANALNKTQSATARFNGNAVYVYGVLPPTIGIPTANVEFFIDGVLVDQFGQPNVSASDFVYDFLFYANSSLPPGAHEIKIINGKPNGPDSMFILDRIVYT
ncbi:hypothetical protein BDZ94DRAFT_1163339 [Collybia nuda]|uniref:Uncharacterized protein n=1 Tax=Collybia nuda TaxID=64659 RepID=A0A9P5Y7Y2_9AGAR|nr:hypothetical protein BDZ94DRAFT_1163339 [Collybia nuda]